MNSPSVAILGAGPTGLSAAYHLGKGSVLIEQNDRVGGGCRSLSDEGFTFDYAGHIMFSNDAYVHKMYHLLLGENVHWQAREAWVYSKGVYTRYPFQGALYGLPPEVIKECVLGAIEARFGPLAEPQAAPRPTLPLAALSGNGKSNLDQPPLVDCCADGTVEALGLQVPLCRQADPRNFEEFIYKVWGAGIAKHFAIPYNKKLWTVPLAEMETSWLGGRVPLPDLAEIIDGALKPVPKPMGPNARFGYPIQGGFQALMDGFLPHLQGELWLSTAVVAVSPRKHTLTLADGRHVDYTQLISSIPLPRFVALMGNEAPPAVRQAAAGLRHVSVRCVNLGIGQAHLTDKHWIYYPEDTVFHRIFVQGNASPACNPPGGFGVTCEITYSRHKPLPDQGRDLIDRCIMDCQRVGLFKKEAPIWAANQVDIPYAYVVYDHARAHNVATIRDWLAKHDILLAGRYSEWEYYNSDHAFLAGKRAAEQILKRGAKVELRAAQTAAAQTIATQPVAEAAWLQRTACSSR